MSFGPSNTTKTAENNLAGVSGQATGQSTAELGLGTQQLAAGAPNVTAGTNFLDTILNGNQANTSALLAPSIQQAQQGNQAAIQGLSTLTPRGGGRSGTLFGASYAPEGQITNLFNNARTSAATALPQIGLAQEGLGSGLIGTSNQPLSTAAGASSNLGNLGVQQQQVSNSLWGGLGSGLFGLASTPFGGGSSKNGLLGLI